MTSAIPLAGYAATAVKAGKYAKKGIDAADSANDVRKTANTADTANDARKTTSKPDSGKNSGGSCPVKQPAPQSFVAGTQVVMADGTLRDIEDLELGDLVPATGVETGESAARPVTDTRDNRGEKHLVTLTVDPDGKDGEAKPGKVTSTDAHLYWLPDYGRWVPAKDLAPGMWLQTSAGTWVQITAIDTAHRTDRVYNLTVEGAGHAEQRAWQELQQKHPGIQPDQVSRVYTELAPATTTDATTGSGVPSGATRYRGASIIRMARGLRPRPAEAPESTNSRAC
ncbi:Hint domain-containing protein [Streptomyces sp. NPDC052079]|uniref:Hint domain-containing protein n=1 Tax=Streptomyces sp. NPDC052079 TaxID=3155526 RepID=UPI00343FBB4C